MLAALVSMLGVLLLALALFLALALVFMPDTGQTRLLLVFLPVVILAAAAGCQPLATVAPSLGAVLSRVDVPRLLRCGRNLPNIAAAATCLGAQAATQGLRIALDRAMYLAEEARDAAGPAGAADTTPKQRAKLAGDLDDALVELAVEIDATSQL